MSISTSMLADDLDAMIADLPSTLVSGSDTVTGTAGEISKADDVAAEGVLNEADLLWVGAPEDFTTVPSVRSTVTAGGVLYYVERRVDSPDGMCVELYLRRV